MTKKALLFTRLVGLGAVLSLIMAFINAMMGGAELITIAMTLLCSVMVLAIIAVVIVDRVEGRDKD